MPPASFVIIIATLMVHRVLLVSLPLFSEAVRQNLLVNFGCGLLSDASLALMLYPVWSAFDAAKSPRLRTVLQGTLWVATALLVASMAAQVRYAQHFGMTVRPYHLNGLTTFEVWGAGLGMVLESWRGLTVLLLGPALGLGLWKLGPKARRFKAFPLIPRLAGALVLALLANSGVILMRAHRDLNIELRYNPLSAMYFNAKDYQMALALPRPSKAQIDSLRRLLHGSRAYADDAHDLPLWQNELPQSAEGSDADIGKALAKLIQDDGGEPWNVVLLISESLRAKELHAFGNRDELMSTLTPEIDRIAGDGVRFTEVIGAGLRTNYGQAATLCSLYTAEDMSLLSSTPMANAVCLPDVFAARGYETFFFYPANNNFDNQYTFYKYHRTEHVFGEFNMPTTGAKGGWGYSDHALFNFTTETLEKAKKPFFSVVLTLTNHGPHVLPADAPTDAVDRSLPIREQIIRYVDWSTGAFYDDLMKRFPRTIFIMIADHGSRWDDAPPANPFDTVYLRDVARIPWLLVVPGLEDQHRNHVVEKLVSNTDVPPTLLKLLGWNDVAQQFMGEDAFTRTGPVYTDWQFSFLEVTQSRPGAVSVRPMEQEVEDTLRALGRYNMLAPTREEQRLGRP